MPDRSKKKAHGEVDQTSPGLKVTSDECMDATYRPILERKRKNKLKVKDEIDCMRDYYKPLGSRT